MKPESQPLFVDTWGWIALADKKDPAHDRVVAVRRSYSESGGLWITTDYVLDELITRLFAAGYFNEAKAFCDSLFQAQDEGWVRMERITPERFQSSYRMRLRYKDKPRISFTDLTSFVVMKELGIRRVLTADAHFTQAHLGFQAVP